MDIAPAPRIAALERRDHRMPRRIEMLQRVGMLRVFTTAHVAARETDAQLCPRRTDGDAVLAAVGARRYFVNLGEMFALLRHLQQSWGVDF
jgi:hypothetical protein